MVSDFNDFLKQLHTIESNVYTLNESDGNATDNSKQNPPADQNNKGDNGEISDEELDNLLKGTSDNAGGDQAKGGEDDLADLNNLGMDTGTDANPSEAPTDTAAPAKPADTSSDSGSDNKNFETDSEGLVDAITKLAKSGHTVKIMVSAEGKQYIDVDGTKLTNFKQLSEYANKRIKGGIGMQENVLNSIMAQINSLSKIGLIILYQLLLYQSQ